MILGVALLSIGSVSASENQNQTNNTYISENQTISGEAAGEGTYTEDAKRIAGEDRIETACKIAENGWSQSDSVILSRSDLFPDALSGSSLSKFLGSPILLTIPKQLDDRVVQTLQKLQTKKVIILGTTVAVSEDVEKALKQKGFEVERIAGSDRYETSAEIAKKLKEKGVNKILIATGTNFPDALAAAPYAAKQNAAILLTDPNNLRDVTKNAINYLGVKEVTIIGGTAAVSQNVENQLKAMGLTVSRIAGLDRYETAVKIAEKMTSSKFIIATGENFPDALAGGALAIKQDAIILLVKKDQVPQSVRDYLKSKSFTNVWILGGEKAVIKSVEQEINKIITGVSWVSGEIHGVWMHAEYAKSFNVDVLKKAGITDIFIKANRISTPTYQEVLKTILDKTKGTGIRVHAWISCFMDADGKWIDPGDTNQQTLLLNYITDIVKNYDISGIHLDYVRYSGSEKYNRAAYQQQPHGAETITSFVQKVCTTVKSIKSNVAVSAAVMPECQYNADLYGQDYEKLAQYLDFLVPMIYKGNYKQNTAWIGTTTKYIVEKASPKPVLAGILTYRSDSDPTILPSSELKQDIKTAMDNGAAGYVLFRYGLIDESFLNNSDPGSPTNPPVENPTTFTISQIQDAAGRVKSFIEINYKLPNYVEIAGKQVTMPQFLQLLITATIQLNQGVTTSLKLIDVGAPSNPTGDAKNGDIQKTEYLDIAQKVKSFIESNKIAPNYATSSLGKIQYESLIYIYSKIVNFYSTNGRLPSYVTVINTIGASVVVKVLIYSGLDASVNCINNLKSCLDTANASNLVSGIRFVYATSALIDSKTLTSYDVLAMPGGVSGSSYLNNPNISGSAIKEFVASGKGYFGTCAGAYAAAYSTDGYYYGWGIAPNVRCKTVEYIGNLPITITSAGEKVLGCTGTQTLSHYRGPAMYSSKAIPMATYADTKTGYKDYIAIVGDTYGSGRTILCGPHPELSPMNPEMVARMIAWAAKKI